MPTQFNEQFFTDLSRSAEVQALVVDAAERVAAIARNGPQDTGTYVGSIGVSVKFQRRAVALVTATDPKAMIIEARTGNLARALRAAKRRG